MSTTNTAAATFLPQNVTLVQNGRMSFTVLDHDGTVLSTCSSRRLAEHRVTVRRGQIKAVLTRRARAARATAGR